MEKRRNKRILALVLVGLTATAVVTASVAWFKSGSFISLDGSNGGDAGLKAGTETFYYAGGSGTKLDPYIIANRTHLYNLAWLQYIGTYNTPTIQQNYFEIQLPSGQTTLDMDGLTLPPIGTDTYPFLGNFDGNGYTISNLIISNDNPKQSDSAFGSAKPNPTSIPDEAIPPEVVGFFGVVGKLPEQDISYSSSVVSVSNVILKNLTVSSKTEKTLIGLAAGYIDGAMSGVRVSGTAKLDLASSGKQKVSSTITNNVSDYGLVGYSAQAKESIFTQEISKYYASDDPAHGGAPNWGGTFDSRGHMAWIYKNSIATRVNNNVTMEYATVSKNGTKSISNSIFNLSWKIPNKSTTYVTSIYGTATTSTQYDRYANPDNIDIAPKNTTIRNATTKYVEYEITDNTYIPLKFEQDVLETDYSDLSVSNENTGYLLGSNLNGNDNINVSTFGSFYYGAIANSLKDNNSSDTSANNNCGQDLTYNSSNLELLTYSKSDGGWRRIKDKYNKDHSTASNAIKNYAKKEISDLGLVKYTETRDKLENLFTSRKRIQGIHFTRGNVNVGAKRTFASGIKVLGQDRTNYELPKGAIDFNLATNGYITYFAGSYNYDSVTTFPFFSLYKVNRDNANNSGEITSIQKISKVYNNPYYSTYGGPKYFYEMSNFNSSAGTYPSTSSYVAYSNIIVDSNGTKRAPTTSEINNATLVCDIESASSTNIRNVLYYFEIPVDAGEYALGNMHFATGNTTFGANLIYLDIGVNGDDANSKKITGYNIKTTNGGLKFPAGVDFEVVGTTGDNGIKAGGVSFCIQIEEGASGSSTTFAISSTNVSISSSSIASKYSFKGSNYSNESSPPSGKFNVTNGPNSTIASTTEIVRVSHIKTGTVTEITVTDILSGIDAGKTTYKCGDIVAVSNDNNGTPDIPSAITSIAPLLTAEVVNNIRGQIVAVTLARNNSGVVTTFDSVLPSLPWGTTSTPFNNIYDVTINSYPSGLIIDATRSSDIYGLKINSASVSFNDNIGHYTVNQ